MNSDLKVIQFTRRPASGAYSIERVFENIRTALPSHIAVKECRNKRLSQGILPRLRDAWAARKFAAPVNHVTGDTHYLTYFLPRTRTVLTIHDTVLVDRERGAKRFLLWLFWFWLPAQRCSYATTISEETKRRFLELVHFDPARVTVIPNPVSPDFIEYPMPDRTGPFQLLHIGTKPNKNLERLIPALAGLDVELTIIGKMTKKQRTLLNDNTLPHRTLSELDDAKIRAEYKRCEALIFVSLDEGFGLPIIEAQASGRPVITSAKAPMNNVAGDAALLIDPNDPDEIRTAVQKLAGDAELRADLIARGRANAKRFSVEAIASAYADLYIHIDAEATGDV